MTQQDANQYDVQLMKTIIILKTYNEIMGNKHLSEQTNALLN
jgi:hypothetical protein